MKVKNADLVATYEHISSIGILSSKSARATSALARNKSKLKSIYESYMAQRKELFVALFGNVPEVDKTHDNYGEWTRSLEKLNLEEVEYEPYVFQGTDLGQEESLSPSQLEAIFWLMKSPT